MKGITKFGILAAIIGASIPVAAITLPDNRPAPMSPAMTTEEMCREAYDWRPEMVTLERRGTDQQLDAEHQRFTQSLESIMQREQVASDIRPRIREGCGLYLTGIADRSGYFARHDPREARPSQIGAREWLRRHYAERHPLTH